ncbi:hypothetical protein GIB67_037949 [Kingdonia uniflora]|uniref:Uncharacterized protein n=1 Tax=Kingdonia uniflora TaxID=39325 RepID=A0A7J7LH33_9MAGN|nr:hypothetical protein GIB67_037949 [Kingdonia uniflora]
MRPGLVVVVCGLPTASGFCSDKKGTSAHSLSRSPQEEDLLLSSLTHYDRYPEMEMFLSDSDCGNFSDSSDSDCFDDIDSLYGGQAQSIFSNLERSIGMIDDLLAFERGFLHGDTVCSVNDPSGQLGRVVEVDMVVDLENIYGKTVKEVNSKTLLKIRSFVAGDYIVHGQWLGRVNRVIDRVTIVFDDGAKCEITAFDPETLVPISRSVIDDSQYPYYPGQRVRVRFLGALESTKWLCGAWKENRSEGMVCHLEAGLVFVDWVASTMLDADVDIPVPSPQQDSENLTLLSCFSHASWQLGDWCILQQKTLNTNFEELYVIVKRKYKVDVLWQDATHSVGLNSQSLFPVNNVGDHEFWPDQFVLEKGISDDPCVFSDLRVGIVKSVNAEERIVKLNWNYHAANRINKLDGESDETVSAYELIEHPDYSFCLGDIIFRSENIQNSLSLVQVDGLKELESHPNAEIGEGCLEFPYQRHLSCIGNVIDFKDGNVEVRWASGLTSKWSSSYS